MVQSRLPRCSVSPEFSCTVLSIPICKFRPTPRSFTCSVHWAQWKRTSVIPAAPRGTIPQTCHPDAERSEAEGSRAGFIMLERNQQARAVHKAQIHGENAVVPHVHATEVLYPGDRA